MPRTIFIQLGIRDKITLHELIESLKNFLGVLRDLDAAISKDMRGTVTWEVVTLEKKSPALIGIAGIPKKAVFDVSEAVEQEFISGVRSLTIGPQRGEHYSDSALTRVGRLAKTSKKVGTIRVYTDTEKESLISESTLSHVQQLIGVKYVIIGSVVGDLDAITVHKANEFRIWDENTGKPVRCFFSSDQEDMVKDLLRRRVLVRGDLSVNNLGQPISIQVETIDQATETLPTISQMSGLISDFTGGKSLAEYMRDIDEE